MRQILVTGASGVVGSEVVASLLGGEDLQIRILLRADSPDQLAQRLDELYTYWQPAAGLDKLRRCVRAVAGDACRPQLGLEPEVYRKLAGDVTHAIHCAGHVKLNQSLAQARLHAVSSAERIVEFAKDCQSAGQLEKVDVVSTIGVAGKMNGLIPERYLSEPREFHNHYEAAKAEAEALLVREMERGLPLTIHRPSMVVGHSLTGRIRRLQVFYQLCEFLTGARTWGVVPSTGERTLDVIPVDYVAAAISLASANPDSAGRVFHLCSGPRQAILLADLRDGFLCGARHRGRRLPRPRVLPCCVFRLLHAIARPIAPGRLRRSLTALDHFLAYLRTDQAFDVRQTVDYLRGRGLALPRVNDYLPNLVRARWPDGSECSADRRLSERDQEVAPLDRMGEAATRFAR